MYMLNIYLNLKLWTLLLSSSLFLPLGCCRKASLRPLGVSPEIDCPIRELAWEYARKLLPQRGQFMEVYDALQLGPLCNISLSSGKIFRQKPFLYQVERSSAVFQLFVDSKNGDDSNPGTLDKPLKTLGKAVKVFKYEEADHPGFIYLREGVYFLSSTIALGPEDSSLTISGYMNEKVVISGGRLYKFKWSEYVNEMGPLINSTSCMNDSTIKPGQSNQILKYFGNVTSAVECQSACQKNSGCFSFTYHDKTSGQFSNMCYFRVDGLCPYTTEPGCTSGKQIHIMVADLSDQSPNTFTSLFIDRRAVRARYPDGNPETMGLHTEPTGYVPSAESWLPPIPHAPATEIHISSPERNHTHFPQFQIGIGGPVSAFVPPESFWGTAHPAGGGGRTYTIPSGLQYLSSEVFANRTWKRPEVGVVHAFHCRYWGNWQFALEARHSENRSLQWSRGGFQEARGCKTGGQWYVENIFEELDAPDEWYFDDIENKLYYYPNGSLPSEGIGTDLDRLIAIQGSQQEPVYNITLTNLTFAHSAPTFLDSYEVPSGGDWAIHRGGAVFVEGVNGFLLQNCLFDAPGGNGLFLSNYIRNAVIEGNEFVYTGDSAILAVGSTNLIDGTDGNQPRGTKVIGNLAHEIGIFGKQTSPYMQALACQTEIIGNVFFNGARAGILFNDGFGGGNLVKNNLLFNFVRETNGHGPFSSWDRQPYLTKVRNGSLSLIPAQSNTTHNFLLCTYQARYPINHDDGSCYYYDTYNFNVYGGFKDFLGHSVIAMNNIYVYPDASQNVPPVGGGANTAAIPFCATVNQASRTNLPSGWGEVWDNNTCVIGRHSIYYFNKCDPVDPTGLIPFTANNSFYAPDAYIYIQCGDVKFNLTQYQKKGYDIGSTVSDLPTITQIIKWGRELLGL